MTKIGLSRSRMMENYQVRFCRRGRGSDAPIDSNLRTKINEYWYSKGFLKGGGSGLNRNVGIGLEKEQKMVIPAMRKLIARSTVFEGYMAQYEVLETQQMMPSEFEQKIKELPESSAVDGYLILEPEQKSTLLV